MKELESFAKKILKIRQKMLERTTKHPDLLGFVEDIQLNNNKIKYDYILKEEIPQTYDKKYVYNLWEARALLIYDKKLKRKYWKLFKIFEKYNMIEQKNGDKTYFYLERRQTK